jgi:hypothetical protein
MHGWPHATAAVGGAFAAHGLVQIGKRVIDRRRAAPTRAADLAPQDKKDGES